MLPPPDKASREVLLRAFAEFERFTCIRFVAYRGQRDFISIIPMSGYVLRGMLVCVQVCMCVCARACVCMGFPLRSLGFSWDLTKPSSKACLWASFPRSRAILPTEWSVGWELDLQILRTKGGEGGEGDACPSSQNLPVRRLHGLGSGFGFCGTHLASDLGSTV